MKSTIRLQLFFRLIPFISNEKLNFYCTGSLTSCLCLLPQFEWLHGGCTSLTAARFLWRDPSLIWFRLVFPERFPVILSEVELDQFLDLLFVSTDETKQNYLKTPRNLSRWSWSCKPTKRCVNPFRCSSILDLMNLWSVSITITEFFIVFFACLMWLKWWQTVRPSLICRSRCEQKVNELMFYG